MAKADLNAALQKKGILCDCASCHAPIIIIKRERKADLRLKLEERSKENVQRILNHVKQVEESYQWQ